ncbi:65-kDa microtubule-associated protein 3-like [Dorcoceras hygrometricum]|uniref:65-kDa microtubule-associated protein 3-like n=1 Tax=Dorcoceras hygrometricum TaxID=472368 RepID=A0A2Z7APS7_9LAMI|nr:65-kDa microtubule-associated protein 3-like [Dorcoceras hygrometricum]
MHSLFFTLKPEFLLPVRHNLLRPEEGMNVCGGGFGGAGDQSPGAGGPCGACKFLRRKCLRGCIFAPYFDSDQGTAHFAAVHRVFGASNASKLLLRIPPHRRFDAVITLCYEALARVRDPVYGCVGHIFSLQQQVVSLQAELAYIQARISTLQRSSSVLPLPSNVSSEVDQASRLDMCDQQEEMSMEIVSFGDLHEFIEEVPDLVKLLLFTPFDFAFSETKGCLCKNSHRMHQPSQMETTCGSLLSELQRIWDEIGEPDSERDQMLFELEQECLEAYRRKVDQANHCRAQMRQSLADSETQLVEICAALGDQPVHIMKSSGSLNEKLQDIMPQLEDIKKKRNERKGQFAEVMKQINIISMELSGSMENKVIIDESDLSLKSLNDLENQLRLLQKEKSERLKHVLGRLNVLNSLCVVLGMDYKLRIRDIHPTLEDSHGTKSISVDTVERLSSTIHRLKDVKLQRMQKLQHLAMTMVELWNLMDTPLEEQQNFQNVTRTIAASEDEITEPNTLSLDFINNIEAEVTRLEEMKSSKMKEVLSKKRMVLEEICREAHMAVKAQYTTDISVEAVESEEFNPSYLLEQLEFQISNAKEEAFSRKEILEKVDKWLAACEEECWLEEYNRDENRYNAGRGTHLLLKRAEKARTLVNKISGMVETLKSKAKAWEMERGTEFLYDGVGLMSMIEQYCDIKHLKEQERQRQRDQKKLQGQLMTEQEAMFGSKQSPSKSVNKNSRPLTGKRFSLGGAMLQNMLVEKVGPHSSSKNNHAKQPGSRSHHHSGLMVHSSGKKSISSSPLKQQSSNANNTQHIGSSPIRKPLSPLSSFSSNMASFDFKDQNLKSVEYQDTHNVCKTPAEKILSCMNHSHTPKTMTIPMPTPPPTVSTAMQITMTPFSQLVGGTQVVDYSCEEIRAGFIVPQSHSNVSHQ